MINSTADEAIIRVLKILKQQEEHYLNQMEGAGERDFLMNEWAAGACANIRSRIAREIGLPDALTKQPENTPPPTPEKGRP